MIPGFGRTGFGRSIIFPDLIILVDSWLLLAIYSCIKNYHYPIVIAWFTLPVMPWMWVDPPSINAQAARPLRFSASRLGFRCSNTCARAHARTRAERTSLEIWGKLGASNQWPFQEPKLEVPTIHKAYFSGLCKGISHKIRPYMVQYLHFRILKFPLI